MTVVVKATFDIVPGELELAASQAFAEGERWVDDDVERALASPSDLVPFKRQGECFVLGACHPPGGRARRSQIAFQVGPVQKNVAVSGDRTFEAGLASPAEFTSMPLTWERAFRDRTNPVGAELPNLEDPQALIQSRDDRPPPVCTTPIAPSWPQRARLAGTYDGAYLRTHYPGLPADIDWGYFNSAPADQRIPEYWRGNEEIVLVNLLEGEPSLRTRLPGLRPRAFLTPAGSPDPLAELWELPLRLDTIVIDGEAREVRCVWRAVLDVASEELDEMGALCVLHEPAGARNRSLDACREVFAEAGAREAAAGAEMAGEAPPPVTQTGQPLFKTLVGDELKWAHVDQAQTVKATHSSPDVLEELAALLKAKGIDPSRLDPSLARVLEKAPADEEPPAARAIDEGELRAIEDRVHAEEHERWRGERGELRERVRRAVAAGESCAGWDLSGLDLSGLSLSGGDFRGATFVGASFAGAALGDAVFDDALFEEAELSDVELLASSFRGATFHFCRLLRARFASSTLDGASFTECLFREGRFSQCFARGTELLDSFLDETTFDDSVFDGADFTGSLLDGALFSRTSLVDAWLVDGVKARGMRLRRCDVGKLRASNGTDLSGATFAACYGEGARFGDAIAEGTDFSFSELDRATFSGASLAGAKLMGCRLRKARFDRARLEGAKLIRADLYEARFERADLRRADLRGANLYGAELLDAQLEGVEIELAELGGTRLAR